MRMTTISVVFFLLLSSIAVAMQVNDNQGGQDDTGQPDDVGGQPELISANGSENAQQNKPEDAGMMANENAPKNLEEVRAMVQQRQQEMEQERTGMGEGEAKAYQNQNQVRATVQALIGLGEMEGGLGSQVREVARNFNNSVQATIQAEAKVQERSGIAKFFAGGDHDAANEIKAQVQANNQNVERLRNMVQDCDCGDDVKTMAQEQIRTLEQEQTRLNSMAEAQLNSKGLLGWMWK